MEVRFIGCGSTIVSEIFADRDIITVSIGSLHNKWSGSESKNIYKSPKQEEDILFLK